MMIPQPSILEEPPIPVGLQLELQAQQKPSSHQQYPSIALELPNSKPNVDDNQKKASDAKPVEDVLTTLSQQEELSVKGLLNHFSLQRKKYVCSVYNQVENNVIY